MHYLLILSLTLLAFTAHSRNDVLANAQRLAQSPTPSLDYTLFNHYPHRSSAYTQGLVWHQGTLYESTGQYGHSSLESYSLKQRYQQHALADHLFAEGLTLFNQQLYQLTWKQQHGLIYTLDLEPQGRFTYQGEGWGLTHDGQHLIKSNGSAQLSWHRASDFQQLWQRQVHLDQHPLRYLNELEYINGHLWANVWYSDWLAIIQPDTGQVIARLDLSPLRQHLKPAFNQQHSADVANGIAYNPEQQQIYITGKYWSRLFVLRLSDSARAYLYPSPTPQKKPTTTGD